MPGSTIRRIDVADVRFPTSLELHGSDAMNLDPDYSAAYVSLVADDATTGYALAFTIGRGNDVQCAAIEALEPLVVGLDIDELAADPGLLSRRLVNDSHLRWLGPEKGVMHMAIGAVVNAGWDLIARRAGVPVWKLLSGMTPAQLTACIDFRYLTDALTPSEAMSIFEAGEVGKTERIADLEDAGYPAYTTTPGWIGYSDERLVQRCREAVADGFTQIKMKVGGDLATDQHRLALARAAIGPHVAMAVDANQRWDVASAIEWVAALADHDLAWVEEPTSPDDIVGHAAIARGIHPIPVATGEHCQNRVMFKQLLQLEAAQVIQIDAARVGGINENIAILAVGREVRCAGVPPRRWRRAVRDGATPLVLRLRRRVDIARRSNDRVGRPSPRTLHRPGSRPQWSLRRPDAAGVQRRDAPILRRRIQIPSPHIGANMSNGQFDGLVAVVTGGASGIGLATANMLASDGATVVALDLVPTVDEPLVGIECDVSDDDSIRAAIAAVVERFSRIDIVINNAGIGAQGSVADNDDDEWARVFDVNVVGMVRVARAALPYLQQSDHAAIVNTGSIAGWAGLPQRALYSASKGAVHALTLAMAADHLADGIRVNAVAPGTADTPWIGRLLASADDPEAERAALAARQPSGRLVSADEVAAAICYLASPQAGSTSGTILGVDGGMFGLRLRPKN